MITIKQIETSTAINANAKQWARDNLEYLNSSNKLLGSSIKVEKGSTKGFVTAIVYLQPANKVAAKTLCAGAKMAGCLDGCLISSGQLGMTTGQNAATRRTIKLLLDSYGFYSQLRAEITKEHNKHGDKLAIRLNGTSDIDFNSFIASMPAIRFYDYTKVYKRVVDNMLSNYDLTYSGSANSAGSIRRTAKAIKQGHRVAIAFNTGERKGEFKVPGGMLDFDSTDLRFLDEKSLGSLKMKGGSIAQRKLASNKSFFYTPATYNDLIKTIEVM